MKRTTALFATAALTASLFAGIAFTSGAEASVAQPQAGVTEQARPEQGQKHRGQRANHLLETVADLLGMDTAELRVALMDGSTLVEIAETQSISADELTAALTAELEAKLTEAVANDRITQERADEILANSGDRIDQFINSSHEKRANDGRGERTVRRVQARQALSEYLDLNIGEMRTAFLGGSTLGDIADDQGISEDDLTTFMIDYANTEIDEALADGTITEERAEQFRDNLAERIERRIDKEPGHPGQGRGPGNHRP